MLVFGTRPEAIKMAPLVKEFQKHPEIFKTIVCVTGQHRQMLDQVLDAFKVTPDYDLSIMKEKQTLFDITTNILMRIKEVLEEVKPDVVLVHGDTSTTFVTALACFYMHIPVGHVEAGLRTYNLDSPWPEEFNRQAVSIISKFNFAPTELSLCLKDLTPIASFEIPFVLIMFCKSLMFEKSTCVLFSVLFKIPSIDLFV